MRLFCKIVTIVAGGEMDRVGVVESEFWPENWDYTKAFQMFVWRIIAIFEIEIADFQQW